LYSYPCSSLFSFRLCQSNYSGPASLDSSSETAHLSIAQSQ
jgi:hypothetical protein